MDKPKCPKCLVPLVIDDKRNIATCLHCGAEWAASYVKHYWKQSVGGKK